MADVWDDVRRVGASGDFELLTTHDANAFLMRHFAWAGPSMIDWDKTRLHRGHHQPCGAKVEADFASFFADCLGDRADEIAVWCNLGCPFALRGPVKAFGKVQTEVLVEVPHTSFLIAESGEWCLTLTMDGRMDFGLS